MSQPYSEADLEAYLDEALAPETMAGIEAALRAEGATAAISVRSELTIVSPSRPVTLKLNGVSTKLSTTNMTSEKKT